MHVASVPAPAAECHALRVRPMRAHSHPPLVRPVILWASASPCASERVPSLRRCARVSPETSAVCLKRAVWIGVSLVTEVRGVTAGYPQEQRRGGRPRWSRSCGAESVITHFVGVAAGELGRPDRVERWRIERKQPALPHSSAIDPI
jgi:hypothetical protein